MAVRIKIQLDAEAGRLADTVQKAVAKGFQGAGASGLATNPLAVINQIMGTPGSTKKLPPEWLLRQGAERALSMGGLFDYGGPLPPKIKKSPLLGILESAGVPTSAGALGAAATTAAAGAALAATVTALAALKRAIQETVQAFDDARKLYAKGLESGMGLPFTTMRANFSSVLGVDEKEIFRFGANLAILAPRLQFANRTMSESALQAGSVGQEIKILELNFKALFMEMAADVAPAIRQFISGIAGLAEVFSSMWEKIKPILESMLALSGGANLAAIVAGATLPGADKVIEAFLRGSAKYNIGALPGPAGFMKQLPVSALERMGLVIGGFGAGTDYARRTAIATEKTARVLEQGIGTGGGSFRDPLYNSP